MRGFDLEVPLRKIMPYSRATKIDALFPEWPIWGITRRLERDLSPLFREFPIDNPVTGKSISSGG